MLKRDRAMAAMTVMLDIAFHGAAGATVSANDIADRLGTARRGLEPLLQALARAGLLESVRGPRGGYRLGRGRKEITLADIATACGGDSEPDSTPASALQSAVIHPLWTELEQGLHDQLAALSLADLLKRASKAGLARPDAEPLNYAI